MAAVSAGGGGGAATPPAAPTTREELIAALTAARAATAAAEARTAEIMREREALEAAATRAEAGVAKEAEARFFVELLSLAKGPTMWALVTNVPLPEHVARCHDALRARCSEEGLAVADVQA